MFEILNFIGIFQICKTFMNIFTSKISKFIDFIPSSGFFLVFETEQNDKK